MGRSTIFLLIVCALLVPASPTKLPPEDVRPVLKELEGVSGTNLRRKLSKKGNKKSSKKSDKKKSKKKSKGKKGKKSKGKKSSESSKEDETYKEKAEYPEVVVTHENEDKTEAVTEQNEPVRIHPDPEDKTEAVTGQITQPVNSLPPPDSGDEIVIENPSPNQEVSSPNQNQNPQTDGGPVVITISTGSKRDPPVGGSIANAETGGDAYTADNTNGGESSSVMRLALSSACATAVAGIAMLPWL